MFLDFYNYSTIWTKIFFIFLIFLSVYHTFYYKINNNFFRFEKYFFLFYIFVPLILFIPFSFNILNSSASPDYANYRHLINDVIFINFIGIVFYVFGTYFCKSVPVFLEKFSSITSFYFWSGFNNKYFSSFYIFIGLLIVFFMFLSGISLGKGREFSMLNPTIRPMILLYMMLINFFLFYTIANYFFTKKISNLLKVFIILFLSLISGTRGALVMPLVFSLFMYNYCLNKKIKIFLLMKISAYILVLLTSLQAVLILRGSNSGDRNFISDLLYGNTFSDIRDFAWVLSGWNSEYLLGKTQLAGFMSFIPSFLSSFRQEWAWGRFSTDLVNLDSTVHPGLRPGIFGEMFINFGIIGVSILGFALGVLIENYSKIIDKKRDDYQKVLKLYVLGSLFIIFLFNFSITSGFFRNYVLVIIFFLFIFMHNFMSKIIALYGRK